MQMPSNKSHVETHHLLLGSIFNKDQDELRPQRGNEQEPSCYLRLAQVSIKWLVIVL